MSTYSNDEYLEITAELLQRRQEKQAQANARHKAREEAQIADGLKRQKESVEPHRQRLDLHIANYHDSLRLIATAREVERAEMQRKLQELQKKMQEVVTENAQWEAEGEQKQQQQAISYSEDLTRLEDSLKMAELSFRNDMAERESRLVAEREEQLRKERIFYEGIEALARGLASGGSNPLSPTENADNDVRGKGDSATLSEAGLPRAVNSDADTSQQVEQGTQNFCTRQAFKETLTLSNNHKTNTPIPELPITPQSHVEDISEKDLESDCSITPGREYEIDRSMTTDEVKSDQIPREFPEKSGRFYILQCPACNRTKFHWNRPGSAPLQHLRRSHSGLFDLEDENSTYAQGMRWCGILIRDATSDWVESRTTHPAAFSGQQGHRTPANFPQGRKLQENGKHTNVHESNNLNSHSDSSFMHPEKSLVGVEQFVVRDGIFVEPECMAGVPVQKITEVSPYWNPDWVTTDALKEKWENAFDESQKHLADFVACTRSVENNKSLEKKLKDKKQSTGSQYKSGVRLLQYFNDTCPIHPNQLLGKAHVKGQGLMVRGALQSLRSALLRLAVSEIEIEPLQWLRCRLAQLIEDYNRREDNAGDSAFSLSRVLTNILKDPVLSALKMKISNESGTPCSVSYTGGTPTELIGQDRQRTGSAVRSEELASGSPTPLKRKSFHTRESFPPARQSKVQCYSIDDTDTILVDSGDVSGAGVFAAHAQHVKPVGRLNGMPRLQTCQKPKEAEMVENQHNSSKANSPSVVRQATTTPQKYDFPRKALQHGKKYNLSYFKCGTRKFGSPGNNISIRLNSNTEIFEPFDNDDSIGMLQRDLMIDPRDIIEARYGADDVSNVKIVLERRHHPAKHGWSQFGRTIELAFKTAADAAKFLQQIFEPSKSIKVSDKDRLKYLSNIDKFSSWPEDTQPSP